MSVRQKHANAYAAVAQPDGAVSEVEQRRLEQQGEVYRRLANWTLDPIASRPGSASWRWGAAVGRCSWLPPRGWVRPVGSLVSTVIGVGSKPRKPTLLTYPGSRWSRPTGLRIRRPSPSTPSTAVSC